MGEQAIVFSHVQLSLTTSRLPRRPTVELLATQPAFHHQSMWQQGIRDRFRMYPSQEQNSSLLHAFLFCPLGVQGRLFVLNLFMRSLSRAALLPNLRPDAWRALFGAPGPLLGRCMIQAGGREALFTRRV